MGDLIGRRQRYSRKGVCAMIDTTLSLNYEIINDLLANSVCLTYNPLEPLDAFLYTQKLETEYAKSKGLKSALGLVQIVSKSSEIFLNDYNSKFHYFSDGTLIYPYYNNDDKKDERDNIIKLLKIRGYQIKRVYACKSKIEIFDYDKFLHYISVESCKRNPYLTDLELKELPSKNDFVNECFANGNILLTASITEEIEPEYRKFLALFADGRFYVSKEAMFNQHISCKNKLQSFINIYRKYIRTESLYVSQEYIDALYKEAENKSWFISEKNANNIKKSEDVQKELDKFIIDLFKERKCISVVDPNDPLSATIFENLDKCEFALFSDNVLVSINKSGNRLFLEKMHKLYPNREFIEMQVPVLYIREIYKRLPEFQKGAKDIYIEMLKQKARKLKKIANVSHYKALDIVAKIAGWKKWNSINIQDEADARVLINDEKVRQNIATRVNPDNPLLWEYENFKAHE